jgi:hypothetical protein
VSLYQMITGQGCFNPCKVATWVTERTPLSFSAPLTRDQVLIRVLSIRLSNVFMLHSVRNVRVSLDSLVVYYTLPALSSAVYWDCSLACQPAHGRLCSFFSSGYDIHCIESTVSCLSLAAPPKSEVFLSRFA